MKKIRIIAGDISVTAELNDSMSSDKIWEKLPINGRVNRWGKEIYFEIPIKMSQEPDARADVEIGELGYWPVGPAFCIFWGVTPMSVDDKPRAASPVNILGSVTGDPTVLDAVNDGEPIRLEKDV